MTVLCEDGKLPPTESSREFKNERSRVRWQIRADEVLDPTAFFLYFLNSLFVYLIIGASDLGADA